MSEPQFRPGSIFSRPYFHVLFLLIVNFLIYSNTFKSPFVFDDIKFIVDNSEIKDLVNLWPPSGTRWVGFFTFALNYRIGGLNPLSYHVANLAIHMLNTLLVYWLIVYTFKTPYILSSPRTVRCRNEQNMGMRQITENRPEYFAAFLSALLFACHPIQTQAVTYIWQRVTSLATMFYLLSIVLFIKARLLTEITGQRETSNEQGVRRYAAGAMLYVISLLSAIFAMKTKEISFTLPLLIVLYEFSFFEKSRRITNFKRLLFLLPFLLTLLVIPLAVLGPGLSTYKSDMSMGEELRHLQLNDLTTLSKSVYLLNQFRVIVIYLRLLFFPINQNLDYDYHTYVSFFNYEVLLSLLLHLSILSLGVYLYTKSRSPDYESRQWTRLSGFGILWFYVALSVESSIIPIKDLVFEHRVYLPSIGFFLALTSGIERVRERWEHARKILVYSIFLLIVCFSTATYARNSLWKDGIRLWKDVVWKSPKKFRPHNNLGIAYADSGFIGRAIEEYTIALKISSKDVDARVNLAKAHAAQGHADRAMNELVTALKISPNEAGPHNNLGVIYANQGRSDYAIKEFETAVKLNSYYADAHYNLGKAYWEKGRVDEAIKEYLFSVKINPDLVDAHFNLGAIYAEQGRINDAVNEFQGVLRLNPEDAEACNYLQVLNDRMKMMKR